MGLKPSSKIQKLTCSQYSIHVSVHIRDMKGDWKCLFGWPKMSNKFWEICGTHIRYWLMCFRFTSGLSDSYRNGTSIQLRDIRLSRAHQCQDTRSIISVVGISASLCHHTQILSPTVCNFLFHCHCY